MKKILVDGKFLDYGGQTEIPSGLFGVHSFKMTPDDAEKYGIESVRTITQAVDGSPVIPGAHPEVPSNVKNVVDCIYDRYQPALILEHKNWKEKLEEIAAKFAQAKQNSGYPRTIEFWNEPYLNWADRPGVNYDPRWFKKAQDGKIYINSTGEETALLLEKKQMLAVRKDNSFVHYLASRYAYDYKIIGKYQKPDGTWAPFKWEDGFEFNFRGVDCVMKTLPWFRDKTQKSYYSAEFNQKLYTRMLLAFGEKMKKAAPDMELVAGWDCNMWWEDWTPWETLFKPVIDSAHGIIDGLAEHHYGCDTRMVGAEYELACAYAFTRYGKKLKMFNTEAGGGADPEQPGAFQPNAEKGSALKTLTYTVRDIIHLIYYYPDKAVARAFHQPQNWPGGLDALLFLKELRGHILNVSCPIPGLWCVASLNGNRICVIIYNDNKRTISVPIQINSPEGTSLVSGKIVRPTGGEKMSFDEETVSLDMPARIFSGNVELPVMASAKYVFELDSHPNTSKENQTLHRRQHYSSEILLKVAGGASKKLEIKIPENELKNAKFAKLRIVHNRISKANCSIQINGKDIEAETGEEYWTSEIEIPVKILKPNNKIVLISKDKNGDGFLICSASLVLIH